MSTPVSVIVLTQDEAVNIGDCLRSLAWAEDVIIVDSGSTDDTLIRARQVRPDVRVSEHPFVDFGEQRNWALDNTDPRHAWVLFIDADERVPDACADAIKRAVDDSGEKVGLFLCYRNYFEGTWIKHCTLFPSWQLRLLKLGEVRFEKDGHGQREVTEGPVGYIDEPYDHLGFSKGVDHWLARHEKYSTDEAANVLRLRELPLRFGDVFSREPLKRRRCMKRLAARVRCRGLVQFVYLYVVRLGFLDGSPGLRFCLLKARNAANIEKKARSLLADT